MENEKKDTCDCCSTNGIMGTSAKACGSCGCKYNHMRMLKWLIKIAILVVVFCFAFKIGELKGMLESRGYSDHRAMMGYGGGQPMLVHFTGGATGNGMMTGTATPENTPAAPAAAVTPAQ